MRRRFVAALAAALAAACGHKGPPLPPLVKIPVAPAELTAARRGDVVDLQFIVPAANTDRTRPANIARVDVYGFAGPDIKDEELFKRKLTVASVAVKAPRDPDDTVDPDESAADLDPLVGAGPDQGAAARLQLQLTAASLVPPEVTRTPLKKRPVVDDLPQPLLGPPGAVPALTYVTVGVSTRGRRGPLSARVHVPLVPPPPPPSAPAVTYDESTITVTWSPPPAVAQLQEPATVDVLPATLIGYSQPTIAYYVYEVSREPHPLETRLTPSPVKETTYTDNRIVWGAERCYEVRTVETIGELSLESEAPPPDCKKFVDTFPPTPPAGLTLVPTDRAINLIWNANGEKDLDGYIVVRGTTADKLDPLMQTPIHDTIFRDDVPAGAHYFYAVKAVDKTGNTSAACAPKDATAR